MAKRRTDLSVWKWEPTLTHEAVQSRELLARHQGVLRARRPAADRDTAFGGEPSGLIGWSLDTTARAGGRFRCRDAALGGEFRLLVALLERPGMVLSGSATRPDRGRRPGSGSTGPSTIRSPPARRSSRPRKSQLVATVWAGSTGSQAEWNVHWAVAGRPRGLSRCCCSRSRLAQGIAVFLFAEERSRRCVMRTRQRDGARGRGATARHADRASRRQPSRRAAPLRADLAHPRAPGREGGTGPRAAAIADDLSTR